MGAVSQEYFASIGYDTNKLKPGELPPWMDGVDRTDQPTYANPWNPTPYWSSTPEGMDPQDPLAVQWSPYPPSKPAPAPAPEPTPEPSSGGGGGGNGFAAVAPPQNAPAFNGAPYQAASAPAFTGQMNDAFRARIMELLGTPLDVDPDALRVSPENRAYRLAAQRAEERQRMQLAEEAAAGGWSNSGGFDTSLAQLRQARGEGESQFLGQLAARYMDVQRNQLYQGIQFAMSQGQFEAAQQLQAQLANLEASMRQQSLAEQARQFDLGLGYDYTALGVSANQAATNALLSGF